MSSKVNFLYHQKPEEVTGHTRRSFAGNYDKSTNTLIIGIAGNHQSDTFCKSKGRQIAEGRASVVRKNLQESGKQIIINNVEENNVREVFFKKINS